MKKQAASPESRSPATPSKSAAPAPTFKPPLKPRPRLFYALLGAVGAWIVVLLAMYFTTVYPTRQPASNSPDANTSARAVPR